MNSRSHGGIVPIAFVTETSNTETTAATTLTLTPANTIGNLLVLCIANRPSSVTISSVADTGGNTWTLDIGGANGADLISVYYSLTTAVSGTLTVTMSASSTLVLSCLEFSGITAADVVAATSTGIGSNTPTKTTAATTKANDVVVAWVSQQVNAPTFSAQTAGYNVQTQHSSNTAQPTTLQAAYKIVAATGTQTYGLTSSSSLTWTEAIATFKGH